MTDTYRNLHVHCTDASMMEKFPGWFPRSAICHHFWTDKEQNIHRQTGQRKTWHRNRAGRALGRGRRLVTCCCRRAWLAWLAMRKLDGLLEAYLTHVDGLDLGMRPGRDWAGGSHGPHIARRACASAER